jgi:RecB family exonuclease
MDRVATWFTDTEIARRTTALPTAFEATSRAALPALDFTLTAKADRIDVTPSGHLHIYDYKTGAPPTGPQQANFDKQLLLESAMAELSGFGELAPAPVALAMYISLSGTGKVSEAPLADEPTAKVWAEFEELIASYMQPDLGYTSRRALHKSTDPGDYDQLARFGEWDSGDDPDPKEVC